MPTMQIGGLLEPGLRNDAAQVYAPLYKGVRQWLGDVIWMEGTSDKFQEVFGFLEAPLYFQHWPAESPIPSGSIKSQRTFIPNRDFAIRIYLPRNVEDDQTGTAFQFARMIAQTYAILPEEEFYQWMQNGSQGTTSPLPVVLNSADGNALYITTSRYGVSGGNQLAQTGVTTINQGLTDIAAMKARYINFQNTQSRPYWDPTMVAKIMIFYGPNNTLFFDQLRAQTLQHSIVSSTGAAVTNILNEAKTVDGVPGYEMQYLNSQRITGNAYYGWLRGVPNYLRALWRQVRKGYTEWQGNFVTSDHARDTGQQYVQGDCREGFGSILALSTIKVA